MLRLLLAADIGMCSTLAQAPTLRGYIPMLFTARFGANPGFRSQRFERVMDGYERLDNRRHKSHAYDREPYAKR